MKVFALIFALFMAFNINAQNGLNFDGVDDYVQTSYPGISGSGPRTVEAWIKTTVIANPSAGGTQNVILDWGAATTGARFTFNVLWANAIRLEVNGSGFSGHIPVNDGIWHHVAAVYDPFAANNFTLYVDGNIDSTGNIPTVVNTATSINMRIGQRVDGVKFFDGDIDEVRVWNYARSQSEIIADKSKEFCSTPTGLVAYYQFNQGTASGNNTGQTILNSFINGSHNGTLIGFSLSGTTSNWVSGATLSGPTGDTISPSSCVSYTSPGGNTYTTSGTYYDTLVNAAGCDSLLTINLTITTVDINVSQQGATLTSAASGASWQWLDCGINFTVIPGATSSSFSPVANGNYAVEVTQNGCVDTSACYAVTTVGIDNENHESDIAVFPNPTNGRLSIVSATLLKEVSISVKDVTGRLILVQKPSNGKEFTIDLENHRNGIYFIEIRSKNTLLTKMVEKR